VTVRADKLTFGDLGEDQGSIVAADERADVVHFLLAWKVIPSHRRVMKPPAAVGTRGLGFELAVPLSDSPVLEALLRQANRPRSTVISPVVRPSACLAPRLVPLAPAVELG
jgi:hypothetical protein